MLNKKILIAILILTFLLSSCGEVREVTENYTKDFNIADHVVEVDEGDNTKLTITFAGDVMLHMPIVRAYYKQDTNSYDFTPIFKYVKQINDLSDISVVNLETVINPEGQLSGFPVFNSPPAIIPALYYAGYDLVGTGNNHAYDQGYKGIESTVKAIESEDLTHMGTNLNSNDARARIIEKNDMKIGFLCYTYGLNGFIPTENFHVNVIDEEKLKEDIDYLKTEGAEKIIFFVHWGTEYYTKPTTYMKNVADMAFNLGVDYIIGSHPHVVSSMEYLGDNKEKFVAYSLGNHLSNQRTEFMHKPGTEDGLMVKIELEKDYYTKEIKLNAVEKIPTWLNRYYDNTWHYEIIPIDSALAGELTDFQMSDALRNKLIESKQRTEEIMNIK